jgi:hypothetical protein
MPVTTITNENKQPEVDSKAVYLIDFSKLESVNDLILILGAMGISFSPNHPHWDLVSKFANLANPIYPNQQIQPQVPSEMKLPKLKKVN